MKTWITSLVLGLALLGCQSSKQTSGTMNPANGKAFLIEGNWEANYILNSPKPFAELFAQVKPSISFNTTEMTVSGVAGCNNFTGGFTLDGSKLSFGENMGVTRKMCPDMTGEQLFLETLKKVNSYAVTDQGNTLNLIMGDIAIMRLERK